MVYNKLPGCRLKEVVYEPVSPFMGNMAMLHGYTRRNPAKVRLHDHFRSTSFKINHRHGSHRPFKEWFDVVDKDHTSPKSKLGKAWKSHSTHI